LTDALHAVEKFRSLQSIDVTGNSIPLELRILILSWGTELTSNSGRIGSGSSTTTTKRLKRRVRVDNKQKLEVALLASGNDPTTTSLDLSGCGLFADDGQWLQGWRSRFADIRISFLRSKRMVGRARAVLSPVRVCTCQHIIGGGSHHQPDGDDSTNRVVMIPPTGW
jgi:hypothetical protein